MILPVLCTASLALPLLQSCLLILPFLCDASCLGCLSPWCLSITFEPWMIDNSQQSIWVTGQEDR